MRYKKLVARVKDELGEEKLRILDSSKSFRVLFYLLIGFLNFLLLAGLVIAMIALCTEKEKTEPMQMAGAILLAFVFLNGFIGLCAWFVWHPLIFGFFERGFLVRSTFGKVYRLPLDRVKEFAHFSFNNDQYHFIAGRYINDKEMDQIFVVRLYKYSTYDKVLSYMQENYPPMKEPSQEFINEVYKMMGWS